MFRQLTPNVNLQGINLSGITQKAITVSDILSNYDLMVAKPVIKPDNHVRKGCFVEHCQALCKSSCLFNVQGCNSKAQIYCNQNKQSLSPYEKKWPEVTVPTMENNQGRIDVETDWFSLKLWKILG